MPTRQDGVENRDKVYCLELLNEAGFIRPVNVKIIAFKHKSRRAKLYQAIGKVFPAFQRVLCPTGRLKTS